MALTCSRADTKEVKYFILVDIRVSCTRLPLVSWSFFNAITNLINSSMRLLSYLRPWNKPNVFLTAVAMLEALFSRLASLLSWIEWNLRVPRIVQRGNTCRADDRYRETRNTFAKTIFKVQGCKVKCGICVRLLIAVQSNYLNIWPELVMSFLCDARTLFQKRHNCIFEH